MALPQIEILVSADTKDAEAGLKRVGKGLDAASAQQAKYSRSTSAAAAHTANLTAQFNDIGVMLAAGQSPLMLAVQQGTQVNQVLGTMGGTGRDKVRALSTAFMSMISPANLVTLAVIAGGAALTQWAFSAGEASEKSNELAERLASVRDRASEAATELRQIRLGVSADELTLMDAIAAQQERVAEAQRRVATARGQSARGARDVLDAEMATLRELQNQLSSLQRNQQEKETLLRTTKETADAERLLGEQIDAAAAKTRQLAYEMSVVRSEAMAAAREFMVMQDIRSRFAGEEMVMGQDVLQVGRGDPAPPRARGGGSRGGGASSGVSEREAAIEALVESLKTEREIIEEWYQQSQELIANANAAELETLGGHNEAKLRLEEEYQERLAGIRQAAQSNNIAEILKGGSEVVRAIGQTNSKALKVAQVFAAGQALINAHQGASEELKKGKIGIPAALAVLAQGIGFVNAIRSVNVSSGRLSGAGATGGTTAATPAPETRTVSEIRFFGDFIRPESIVDLINDEFDRGNFVRAVVG